MIEILMPAGIILSIGLIGYFVITIQEWITDMRFYRRCTQRELERARRSLREAEYNLYISTPIKSFDTKKTGTVTATVGYENLKEMGATLNEAEKLIKEARDWKVE